MKPTLQQRLPVLILLIAILLTLIVWGRMGVALATNLPYGRALTGKTASGETVRILCRNSLFIVDQTIIQFPCNYRDASGGIHRDEVAQVDLRTATVNLRWKLNDDEMVGWIYGMIMGADGSFTIAVNEAKDSFFVLGADNSVIRLPDPPTMIRPVSFFYRDKALEVYADSPDGPILASYLPDSGWKTQKLPAPDCAYSYCRLELAYIEGESTVLWYTRVPERPINRENVSVEILRSTGGAMPTVTQTETLRPYEYRFTNDGRFSWNGNILDRTRGNSIDSISDAPFSLQGERWVRLTWPPVEVASKAEIQAEDSSLYMSLLISPGKMERIPRIRPRGQPETVMQAALIRGKWIALGANATGYFLRELGGMSGPNFLDKRYGTYRFRSDSSMLIPASDGGYWLDLGSVGLVRFNERLERIDAPSILDRVLAVFTSPRDVGRGVNNELLLDGLFFQQLGFIFLLLFVPVSLISYAVWRRARRESGSSRALIWLMALYVAVFIFTFSWYGEVVNAL